MIIEHVNQALIAFKQRSALGRLPKFLRHLCELAAA
jgi:hypothetical protein